MNAVFFKTAGRAMAIPLERIVEIVHAVAMAQIPGAAPYITGMMNCRGALMPVIDLAVRLRLEERSELNSTRQVLVVRIADAPFGCLVDEVTDVREIRAEDLLLRERLVPNDVPLDVGLLLAAVRHPGGVVSLLDLDRVLSIGDRSLLESPA